MSARILNLSSRQLRERARRLGWTTHFSPPIAGEANTHDVNAADGPKRKPGKGVGSVLTSSAAVDVYHLVALCKAEGFPPPIPEFEFAAPARKWRADYCWPLRQIIVEIDGAVWSQGRHTRGSGYLKDCEKLNYAALLGFRVLRYAPNQMGECLRDLKIIFAKETLCR